MKTRPSSKDRYRTHIRCGWRFGCGGYVGVRQQHGQRGGAIVDVADREQVDLIVMSTDARTGPARTVVGSVADAVVRRADCPVLLSHRVEPSTGAATSDSSFVWRADR